MTIAKGRALVTGGAGFIGSHLCERLLDDGYDVLCVDNYYSSTKDNIAHLLPNPRFEVIRHDVTFPLYVEVDEIYHLACPASPIHYQRDPVQTTKTAVHGSINMLGLAKRTGAKILTTSTSEVYGDPQVHPQTEDYWGNVNPIGPRACYDEGKRAAETLFFDYHRQHDLRDQGRAPVQHLRPAHAPARRPRGLELRRQRPDGQAADDLRRGPADAVLPVHRRPDRRADRDDGVGRRGHRADQPRQPGRVHHRRARRRWCSSRPDRTPGSSTCRCRRTIRSVASPTSPARRRLSAGSPPFRWRTGLARTIEYFRSTLA